MSDIGLGPGIIAILGAFLTLAIGGGSLFLALVIGALLPYAVGDGLARRLFRLAPGPIVCLVVGGVGLLLSGIAPAFFDLLWFVCPLAGVVLGWIVASRNERAYRERRPQRDQQVSRAAAIAVLVSASACVAAAIIWYDSY